MKVLVTGGAGFVGSHIVDRLIKNGVDVVVVDNLRSGRKEHIHPKAHFYEADIVSTDLIDIFRTEHPQYVIHQAAQVSVQRSLKDPQSDARVNILGTLNVLECCREVGVEKLVYASSVAVYGAPVYLGIDEMHPICPLSFYGVSKFVPELYLKVYHELFGLRYTVLRYANVYGPRQDPNGDGGVVAIFIDKLLKGEQPVIYGDGQQTRDFIYVADVAEANLAALTHGHGHVLNIGTNTQTSINELYSLLVKMLDLQISPRYEAARPGDIRCSYLDNSLAVHVLNWRPKYSLAQGLRETLAYYCQCSMVKEHSCNETCGGLSK